MFEVIGKYNTAKVYATTVEDSAREQIQAICDDPFSEGSTIRIMPDVHTGNDCPIGLTMTIGDKIVPRLVGVDIGCGLEVVRIKHQSIDFEKLDELIKTKIPSGPNVRHKPLPAARDCSVENLKCKEHVKIGRARCSIGTLGGGNHFIEVDEGLDGLYLVIHSGSRNVGKQVADYYHNLAKSFHPDAKFPYLEGEDLESYLFDVDTMSWYASVNRKAMVDIIVKGMGWLIDEQFSTIHNYIGADNILRKGAISSYTSKKMIIPLNMRDGSLIVTGKGNPDWNYSAPHGAGRIMGRRQARHELSVEEFKTEMQGIYSSSVSELTLDESPMSYKPFQEIVDSIGGTVKIIEHILPVYNFKAQTDWKNKEESKCETNTSIA